MADRGGGFSHGGYIWPHSVPNAVVWRACRPPAGKGLRVFSTSVGAWVAPALTPPYACVERAARSHAMHGPASSA